MSIKSELAKRQANMEAAEKIRQAAKAAGTWEKSSKSTSSSDSTDSNRSKTSDSSKKSDSVSEDIKNRMTILPENGKWLKQGSDNVGSAILGSGLDAGSDFLSGIIGAPESLLRGFAALGAVKDDLDFYQNGGIYTLNQENAHKEKAEQSKKDAAKLITTDYYDEDSIAKSILTGLSISLYNDSITSSGKNMSAEDLALSQKFGEDYRKYLDEDMEDDSILGEQMDGLVRSAGQQVFTKAIGGAIPWQLTTGFSTMGDEMAQALNEGATFEEAGLSGMVSAAGEVLSEYIFDADIFGHSSIEEKLVKEISNKVSNKVLQSAMKFGMDATGEGLEEVISGVIGAIGQKLTYGSDKEIKELFSSEEALDSFIGGAIMGGVNSAANGVISKATGTDYVSGLNKSEQAVVDKVYKEQLAKAKKDSKNGKVSASEKTAIYNDVLNSLEKGYLSTDSIEAALGGKAYEDYQSLLNIAEDNEILKAYEDLRKRRSKKDKQKYEGMERTVQRIQDGRKALKNKLDAEVGKQVQGTKLQESYTERTRRGQTFQADLSQYEGKQKEIVQKAVESGVLNNTNRTHEFVDLISSIAVQSDVDYDFTNNATLKNSGFAVEGKQVNGYTTAGGVTLNIDSTKALNRVVGHEITHILEGTELYDQMRSALEDYAKTKGEYDARKKYVSEQYKQMKDVDISSELTAELAGDYLFSDSDFLNKLAQENPDVFQKAWNQIKRICKVATTRTKEGKALDKAQRAYEEAFRKAGEVKKNATKDGGVKYSISKTSDGRPVAVVDNDILKNIDTTKWDKETKKKVRQAATETLKQFKDGFEINGVEYVDNKKTRREYTASNYSEAVSNKNPDVYLDKMRAASVVDDVIHVATDWTKDGKLKHKRSDFVDFIRGKTLFQSGENTYSATVLAGITENGKAVFYDVVDITPDSFETKKSEPPTTVLTDKLPDSILGSSDPVGGSVFKSDTFMSPTESNIAPSGENVKYNVSDNSPSAPKTKADVFGSDIMLAPVREEGKAPEITAPTREDIAKVEQAMNDNFAPIREDVVQRQKLQAEQAELEEKLLAMTAASNFGEEYQALSRQWAEVKNQVEALTPKDGTKLLQEFAEQTKKKDPSPAERVAKEHLENTFTLDKAPDAVKEKFGPKWQKIKEATGAAQSVIINGDKGIKPLAYIENKVNQDGFGGEFELYMRHLLNTDRMSLEERGYAYDKQVFSTDVTAAESRKTADKILKAHPEFAEYEADVRDYVHYLREKLVDCGKISQQTADLWEEMYPHYIPIRRQGFENDHETWELLNSLTEEKTWVNSKGENDDDLFAVHTATVSKLHEAIGGTQQLYPLFDTLAERTLTTFWNAALMDENKLPDDFAPIREDADTTAKTQQVEQLPDDFAPIREDIPKARGDELPDDLAPIREDIPGKTLPDDFAPIREDIPGKDLPDDFAPIREDAPGLRKNRIEADMDEQSRYEVLREKQIPVVEDTRSGDYAQEIGDIESLPAKAKSKVEKFIKPLAEKLGILNRDLKTPDVDVQFQFSKGKGLKESLNKQLNYGGSYGDFAKALVNLEQILDNAVLIERHGDKYAGTVRADNQLESVSVLVGACRDGDSIIPVQMEIKKTSNRGGQLYVTVAMTKIEADVMGSRPGNSRGQYSLISASDCSIADLFAEINPQDKHFLKYVPDGFLSDAQKAAKQSALQEDAKRIAGYAKKSFSGNPTLADDYIERTVLENTLKALKDAGEPYTDVEKRLHDLNRRIEDQEKNPDVQPFRKGQSPKQSTPDPAKRTIQTEPSADSLNVDSHDSEKPGATVTDDSVNYDIRNVSTEVFREMNPLKWAREMILDNGMVFEELSHRTGNKNLDAYWNFTRDAAGRAQYLIGNGSEGDGVTGIKTLYDTAKKAGKLESFEEYLGHCRNIDGMSRRTRYATLDNQSFMGMDVSYSDSVTAKIQLENQNPEFKAWAQQCYDYTDYGISELEKHNLISHEDAQLWKEVWNHYIPIKRTADGNNAGLLETMAQQTLHIQSSVAMNDFAVELMHTLNSKVSEDKVSLDTLVKTFDSGSNLFQATKDDRGWYYFNCYEDGRICKFQISEEMYLALKPASDLMNLRVPGLADFSEFRRKAITEYNIFFALNNSLKDAQTVMIQSQHPAETYANMPGAAWDILNNSELYQEYLANGGDEQQFFHKNTRSLDEGLADKLKRYTGLEAISDLNNFIETVPRFAEYKVSRQKGASIQVAMLDSARVTTNFAAGGQLTKMVNRNGATFLNASIQGTVQLARNVREAQMNGLKGWLALAARICAVGLIGNGLLEALWKDDEDYAALPDYITQNYYILWKNEDGVFYRLSKERTWAVITNAVNQVAALSTGDDTQDWKDFFQFCIENLGPNNPFTNNVGSPISQVLKNETWYHEDLVPSRLQKLPTVEQYDEKTSDIAIWLAEELNEAASRDTSGMMPDLNDPSLNGDVFSLGSNLAGLALDKLKNLSPKQIHYLLDQYSGIIGDELLPLSTPKAEGKSDSLLGKMVMNPLRDIFTVDPVLNNRVTDQFFTTLEDLEAKADLPDATMEDKLKSSVAITCNVELSKLYKQRRELQTSDLPDSEKYEQNRAITKKINRLMEDALDDLSDVHIDGNYAEVGDRRYHVGIDSETGEETWWASSETKADGTDNWWYTYEYLSHENLGMDYADIWNGNFPTDYSDKNLYAEYKGKRYNFDTEEKSWFEIQPKKADGEDNYYYQQEQTAAQEFGISYEDFWNNREKYSNVLYAGHLWDDTTQSYSNDYYTTIRCVLGVDEYAEYCDVLPTLKADVDANGNSISGSKKKKIKNYVNSLDIPDVQKHVLLKVYYPNMDTYNYEILNYINSDNSISYQERVSILEELGAGVDEHGYITWHPQK